MGGLPPVINRLLCRSTRRIALPILRGLQNNPPRRLRERRRPGLRNKFLRACKMLIKRRRPKLQRILRSSLPGLSKRLPCRRARRRRRRKASKQKNQAKTVRAPEVDQAKKVNAPEVENSAGITTSDQQAPMQTDAKNRIATPKRTAKQPLTTAARNKKAGLEEQVPTSLQDADQAKAAEAPENIEKLATRIELEASLQTGAKKKKTKGKQTKKPIEEDVDQAKTVRAPEVDQAKKV